MSINDKIETERIEAERIRKKYAAREVSKLDELRALDRRVKRPAETFAYIFGTVGSLVFGTGMCLAMEVIGDMMIAGIGIGLVGITAVSLTYPIYKKLLSTRRAKHSARIFELSDQILAGNM